MDFIIDTAGQQDLHERNNLVDSENDDDEDIDIDIDPTKIVLIEDEPTQKKTRKKDDFDLDEFERNMGWKKVTRGQPSDAADVVRITEELTPVEKALQKAVIKPGYEQLQHIPRYDRSDRKQREIRRREASKTKGKKWFNMPATEMSAEVRRDLQVIKMRSILDPKHFYKRNDMKTLPKYFQMGKVVDSPLDYYSSRMTNKERKKTIVDELMADAEFARYNKRKFKEIIEEKRKKQYRGYKHAKKLKDKKR